MSKICLVWFFVYTGLLVGSAQANLLLNENFASGLSEWNVVGAVFAGLGEAAVTDENAFESYLYQGVQLDPGTYEVKVDFKPLLSPDEPIGFARDTFFASLYLSSTPESFDPRTPEGFDTFFALFDFDAAGPFDYTGNIANNPIKQDYLIFTESFILTTTSTLFAVFELSDLNGINDNSIVLVDSVTIIIPEPNAIFLSGLTAFLALIFCKRRW